MSVVEFLPSALWREHIAAYWIRKTPPDTELAGRRVYADGCADLICNAGESIAYFYPMAHSHSGIPLYPGRVYLGGTMTAYGVLTCEAECLLTGIRFWPGGFVALFSQTMQPAVDSLLEFPDRELSRLMRQPENLATKLNQYLEDRLVPGALPTSCRSDFLVLRKRMYESGGQVSVEALAHQLQVSNRTLERLFKKNVGIPPKEFLRIVRFQEVLGRLRNAVDKQDLPVTKESLLHIAYDLGYFDHAHLTHEFKKYAGILPSELSHFYKTGLSGGQYF